MYSNTLVSPARTTYSGGYRYCYLSRNFLLLILSTWVADICLRRIIKLFYKARPCVVAFSGTTRVSGEKTVVKSTLRVSEVTRAIDDSIFACRLDLLNPISGYIRSVERTIRVVVHCETYLFCRLILFCVCFMLLFGRRSSGSGFRQLVRASVSRRPGAARRHAEM